MMRMTSGDPPPREEMYGCVCVCVCCEPLYLSSRCLEKSADGITSPGAVMRAQSFVLLFLVILVVTAAVWNMLAFRNFKQTVLRPGGEYVVRDRVYVIPPEMEIRGQAYILKDAVIENLRELYTRVTRFLDYHEICWWVSGGTLLGGIRNQMIPSLFDDDIDLHMHWHEKERLEGVLRDARQFSIESIDLDGYGLTRTTSAIRFKLTGVEFPVLDMFFTACWGEQLSKLDGWVPSLVPNARETWPLACVFPLQRVLIDQLVVVLPRDPVRVLQQQYGAECLRVIIPRPVCAAHMLPQQIMFYFMKQGGSGAVVRNTKVAILKKVESVLHGLLS